MHWGAFIMIPNFIQQPACCNYFLGLSVIKKVSVPPFIMSSCVITGCANCLPLSNTFCTYTFLSLWLLASIVKLFPFSSCITALLMAGLPNWYWGEPGATG